MELDTDAVLMNTGIAAAQEPVLMAEAMKHAVIAGRMATWRDGCRRSSMPTRARAGRRRDVGLPLRE